MARVLEVLLAFLRLGLTSFGGPIAHLGYFRAAFVVRGRWLDEAAYADLVSLCQFLPGPASSQVAFAIGLQRAGFAGAMAAWVGFTLPSAIALVLFASGLGALGGPIGSGIVHGLKLVAVAIVAQAVFGMARAQCPDRSRAAIAISAALVVLYAPIGGGVQTGIMVLGALAGWWLCRTAGVNPTSPAPLSVSRLIGALALGAYALLLTGLPLLRDAWHSHGLAVAEAFYRSGALVFGGGHVVLPLLQSAFVGPGWVSDSTFLAGYGAAQAVPGPLFTFAAYLGTVMATAPNGLSGAALGLGAIFLPGILILVGALPFWAALRDCSGARAAMRGVNASVVGLLGAALYRPVVTSSIGNEWDLGIALAGLLLLTVLNVRPILVVLFCAATGAWLAIGGR